MMSHLKLFVYGENRKIIVELSTLPQILCLKLDGVTARPNLVGYSTLLKYC